jgi:hypothetical protein
MQMNRQELLRSASKRVRRGKRTTGRIVVSALGFGVAYYFDRENGGLRRKRLRQMVEQTIGNVDAVRATEMGDAPPVFHPVLHALRSEGRARHRTEHVEAVR